MARYITHLVVTHDAPDASRARQLARATVDGGPLDVVSYTEMTTLDECEALPSSSSAHFREQMHGQHVARLCTLATGRARTH
jgi:hypothetical protein